MANRMRSETKERWCRGHLTAWRQSRVTIREYCLQHQLSEPNFYAWRRELARRDEASRPESSVSQSVEVCRPARSCDRAKPGSITWMPVTVNSSTLPLVEVQLPTGTVLRVPAGVESVTLERILTALLQATQEARCQLALQNQPPVSTLQAVQNQPGFCLLVKYQRVIAVCLPRELWTGY